MKVFVVDASVGVKWFVPEAHADAAMRLQDPANDLHMSAARHSLIHVVPMGAGFSQSFWAS